MHSIGIGFKNEAYTEFKSYRRNIGFRIAGCLHDVDLGGHCFALLVMFCFAQELRVELKGTVLSCHLLCSRVMVIINIYRGLEEGRAGGSRRDEGGRDGLTWTTMLMVDACLPCHLCSLSLSTV